MVLFDPPIIVLNLSTPAVSAFIVFPEPPNIDELLTRKNSAFSGFIGPNGAVIGEPLIDEEGIVYADIDLAKCIQPKQMHDILGHYNRFDIFDLRVNVAQWKINIQMTS